MEEIGDLSGFEARRKESEANGKLRGFGVNCYIEACGIAPSNLVGQLGARAGLYESATVRVNATGGITVMTGSHSHGQGHETAFPQVVADMLGIDESMIEIEHGDTDKALKEISKAVKELLKAEKEEVNVTNLNNQLVDDGIKLACHDLRETM